MTFTVIYNAAAFRRDVSRQASKFIKWITLAIKAKMIELMKLPKHGRVYVYRGRPYRASAPGEAPAIRSGRLMRSIKETFPKPLTGVIEVGAYYGVFLEFGTARIAPRPFARPAIKGVTSQFHKER